jgi:hypothetical protein
VPTAADENAGPVKSGWLPGVHNAMIIILASDGVTEVIRRMTTRLHTEIQMPPILTASNSSLRPPSSST